MTQPFSKNAAEQWGLNLDIDSWLRSLGLGQYEAAFRENNIDEMVLTNLTVEDLKELGVVPLGHRRKLLDAIAALRADVGVNAPSAAVEAARPSTAKPTETPIAETVGERRHITVLFCDLFGSTGISAGLDAEDWRNLVGAYLNAASVAVMEMGGRVKILGDGLMAVFGYPFAQENDAERAARAALSIQRALAEINRKNARSGKLALNARIGIESGPVVVDAAGEIYGDAPNTAARVQALAEPGTVLVTAQVQRQIAGLFVAEERGTHELKGVPKPAKLFRLVRASGGGRRSGQRHLTPLVGRDEEIAILMRRWERARRGDGQLVLIVGEPGLGKSRLIEEFHARLREAPHTWVEWSCSQLLQNTPLHPIAEWGRIRFGAPDMSAEIRLAELETTLAQVKLEPAENVPLLAPLLGIPIPQEHIPTLEPVVLRRRQLAALLNWVMAGARTQPGVLALEDVHWADPTTLEFLRSIAERGDQVPLLVLITARPEFRPPWLMRSHHTTTSLGPLDASQVRDMVAALSTRHALSNQLVNGVAERTGGVPLFVEEVTRLLLERGEQGGIQGIPPTLQQSLMARLDRLGPARDVGQIGAVIGRGFSYRLLLDVAGIDDAPLQDALDKLVDADILLVQGLPPDADYRFKHALIQDTAYENLLKSRRQVLHRRVAEALLDHTFTAAAEPELLAHHFTQAGQIDAAIEWWGKAGQQSVERSALVEAAEQFTRALTQVMTLPATPKLRREQIKLQVALISPLMQVKGYAAPETKAAVERARLLIDQSETLGEPPDDPLLLFSVLYGFWVANYVAFNGRMIRELADEFLTLAEKQGATMPLVVGNRLVGTSLVSTGEMTQGRAHLDRAIALYDPAQHRPLGVRFSQDIRVATLSYRAMVLWMLGYPEGALADADRAIRDAREIGQAASLMAALTLTSLSQIHCGNYAIANAQLDEVITLSNEKGAVFWKVGGMLVQGCLFATTGKASDAVRAITSGLSSWRATGTTVWIPTFLSYLTRAYAELGQFGEASRCISEAIIAVQTTNESWYEIDIHRIAGEIALKSPEPNAAKAEAYFERALAVARQQQAKSWELRAAMNMARLWRSQGKTQQAREQLAPVYGWFTEGFDTLDLKEAKVLLEELAR
jgi:class 3 adenylate cyclase/predicted ATPase